MVDRRPCELKVGWLSGEKYCRVHGRGSGWPCTRVYMCEAPACTKSAALGEKFCGRHL